MSRLVCSLRVEMLQAEEPQAEAIEEDEVGSPGPVVDEGNRPVEVTQVVHGRVNQFTRTPAAYAVDQAEGDEQWQEEGERSFPDDPVVVDVLREGEQPGQHAGRQLVEWEEVLRHGDPEEEQGEREERLSLPPDAFAVDDQVFERVSWRDQIIQAAT